MTDQERASDGALMDATRGASGCVTTPPTRSIWSANWGAVGACKRLPEVSEVGVGYTRLREFRRLNLTVEAVAL